MYISGQVAGLVLWVLLDIRRVLVVQLMFISFELLLCMIRSVTLVQCHAIVHNMHS